MPLTELPLRVMVILFLVAFVLIAIIPSLRKNAKKLRKLVEEAELAKDVPGVDHHLDELAKPMAEALTTADLDGYEMLVYQRFTREARKAMSLRQLNASLLLQKPHLRRALRKLIARGLVEVQVTPLLGVYYLLSEKGRAYGVEQGYILKVSERDKPVLRNPAT